MLMHIFLKVSQTITRGGPRSQVAIPAQGMIEFRDALTDLLDEFGCTDEDESTVTVTGVRSGGQMSAGLPEGRHVKVDNKNFYLDIGQNNRGVYMRISEASESCSYLVRNLHRSLQIKCGSATFLNLNHLIKFHFHNCKNARIINARFRTKSVFALIAE